MTYHIGERIVFRKGNSFHTGEIKMISSGVYRALSKVKMYKVRAEEIVGPIRVIVGFAQTGLVTSVITERCSKPIR